MKSGRLFIILMILIMFAAACQSETGSRDMADNPTAASADEPVQGSESQNTQDVYPAPQVEPTVPLPAVLYPMLSDGDKIGWIQAQALIKNDEVERISQTHDLEVTLFLKDGRALVTMEPAIDEVLRIIEMCGQACSEIVVATE